MSKRTVFLLIAFFSVWSFVHVAPVAADHEDWREKYIAKKQAMMEEIFKELNLTNKQQVQITKNRDKQKQLRKIIKEKIKAKRSQLRLELEKSDATKESVDQIADELIELIGERVKNRVDGIWTVKQILSPEQFKQLQYEEQSYHDHQE